MHQITLNIPGRLTYDSGDIAEELGKRYERQHNDRQPVHDIVELSVGVADQ